MSMCEHVWNDLYILINIIYCCKSSHSLDKIWFEDKIEEEKKTTSKDCLVKNEGVDVTMRISIFIRREKREREREKEKERNELWLVRNVQFFSLSIDENLRVFLTLRWQVSFCFLHHTIYWFMCTVESISVIFRKTDQLLDY
jgi:hypothetical protein